ncbi:hypothetical protein ES288_D05G444400v1 [Gossypium darwinii]|uniref:Uncharacterized protein n=1 Tax=Gossypium darwinii TaxID=34276 RepID=A0A5D2CQT5_GOSDA|nr:hypothetical protein ES288_D05G444400v1 [Gossypium darwinii]
MNSLRNNFSLQKLVDNADIGKGAPCHRFIIASTTTIGIEVLFVHPTLKKKLSSRAILLDATCRRDVIGGNTVTKIEQAIGIFHSMRAWWFYGHVFEIWRLVNVC